MQINQIRSHVACMSGDLHSIATTAPLYILAVSVFSFFMLYFKEFLSVKTYTYFKKPKISTAYLHFHLFRGVNFNS